MDLAHHGTPTLTKREGNGQLGITERIGRGLASIIDRTDLLIPVRTRRVLGTWGLASIFAIVTVGRIVGAIRLGTLAIDLRIYRAAAEAVIHGADPWQAGVAGLSYAGAPASLIAYLPAALIPESIAIVMYGLVSVLAAVAVLRALRLPIWWLFFPPLAESIIVLNSDVLVIALLVAGGRWAFVSVPLKVYAVIPLLLQRRWVQATMGALLCVVALPLLPTFLADRDLIAGSLEAQSYGGLSAWGSWLLPFTLVALFALLGRGAEWLTVPAIWPYTQLHYNVLALPVAGASPVVAFLLSFAVWPLPAIAAIYCAIEQVGRAVASPYRSRVRTAEPEWTGSQRTANDEPGGSVPDDVSV